MFERLQHEGNPEFLIGSPRCTDFCTLMLLQLTTAEVLARQGKDGKPHVRQIGGGELNGDVVQPRTIELHGHSDAIHMLAIIVDGRQFDIYGWGVVVAHIAEPSFFLLGGGASPNSTGGVFGWKSGNSIGAEFTQVF